MRSPSKPPRAAGFPLNAETSTICRSPLLWFGLLCFGAWISASADRESLTGGSLVIAGFLMAFHPVQRRIHPICWLGAGLWLAGSLCAFLPVAWMQPPAWRNLLEASGIHTGCLITPQPLAAVGSFAEITALGLVALWAAGQQTQHSNALGVLFASAVAIYALAAWQLPDLLHFKSNPYGTFGFFPNRNHTATLLVMGGLVALGILIQGIRWRRPWLIAGGAASLVFLLWVLFVLNISRGGVLLMATGGLLLLLLSGRRYVGGDVGKALALVTGGALLIFLLLDTPVTRRVQSLLSLTHLPARSEGSSPETVQQSAIDSRIPIQRDTLSMINGSIWAGWGAGQFTFIFPQYQNHCRDLSRNQCLHPESDWLWMAAENGVPATLGLAALGLAAVIPVAVSVRQGRSRALRAGLLVASLILPIHGLFDVPGHVFSLLWTSAFLLALAAGHSRESRFPRAMAAGWRVAGTAVAAFGLLMLHGAWKGSPLLATDRVEQLVSETLQICRLDQRTPSGEGDLLAAGFGKLSEASELTPLDARVRGLQGMLALHYDDKDDDTRRAFTLQRLLEPTWVELPLNQADGWIKINEAETGALWKIAMVRARIQDGVIPSQQAQQQVFKKIRQRAGKSAVLLSLANEAYACRTSLSDGKD